MKKFFLQLWQSRPINQDWPEPAGLMTRRKSDIEASAAG